MNASKIKWASLLATLLLCSVAHADFLWGTKTDVYLDTMKITGDYEGVQLGFSLNWNHLSIDFNDGIKRTSWDLPNETEWKKGEWQSGSNVTARIYPFGFLQKYRPLITYVHMSDIARGYPFNKRHEPSAEYLGAGVTFVTRHFEVDLTVGRDARQCSISGCDPGYDSWETQLRVRTILWRQKK